jgi:predicted O-methyltransferase YrrM
MQHRPDGRVYCIDTWQNDAMTEGKWSTFDAFKQNTSAFTNIIPIVGRSTCVQMPFTGQVDLVFIDGDHSYAGVKADVDRFSRLVREGGCLAMHDHAYYPPVTQVIGELLAGGGWVISKAVENIIFLTRDSRWQADMANSKAVSPLCLPMGP